MNTAWKIPLATLIATGLLSGCGAQNQLTDPGDSGASQEHAEVAHQLATSPELVDEASFSADVEAEIGEDGAQVGGSGDGSVEVGPDSLRRPPVRWWRRITGVRRSFEFAFGDTDSTGRPRIAFVTVNKALSGAFYVAKPARDPASPPIVIRKPLLDHWVRRLVLHRVELPGFERPQWRIVGTSGVQITSRAAVTRIVSIRVEASHLDTTIVDPLALFRLRQVLRFDAEDSVRVTVTTLRNDDVVVLQRRDRHFPFRNNGDNTYSARLRVGMLAGVHHLGVNALARGTIFDDRAAYDSQAWILPYVVRPTELADLGD